MYICYKHGYNTRFKNLQILRVVYIFLKDQGLRREEGRGRNPAAYFNGMLEKAKNNKLNLHASVFGLLERADG